MKNLSPVPTPIHNEPSLADLFRQRGELDYLIADKLERDEAERNAQQKRIMDRLKVFTDGPHWMKVDEACEHLRISRATLYEYINQGHFTRYGPPQSPRFRKDDLDAFIERHRSEIPNVS